MDWLTRETFTIYSDILNVNGGYFDKLLEHYIFVTFTDFDYLVVVNRGLQAEKHKEGNKYTKNHVFINNTKFYKSISWVLQPTKIYETHLYYKVFPLYINDNTGEILNYDTLQAETTYAYNDSLSSLENASIIIHNLYKQSITITYSCFMLVREYILKTSYYNANRIINEQQYFKKQQYVNKYGFILNQNI